MEGGNVAEDFFGFSCAAQVLAEDCPCGDNAPNDEFTCEQQVLQALECT